MRLEELLPKETEDGEGTRTTKEELASGDKLDVDAAMTVDGWLGPVVE